MMKSNQQNDYKTYMVDDFDKSRQRISERKFRGKRTLRL